MAIQDHPTITVPTIPGDFICAVTSYVIARDRAVRSFSDRDTEALFRSGRSRRWTAIAIVATRKLDMLDAATDLADLREPPDRLERLSGDRAGQYSIRINSQWRLCFVWTPTGPEAVAIVDFH